MRKDQIPHHGRRMWQWITQTNVPNAQRKTRLGLSGFDNCFRPYFHVSRVPNDIDRLALGKELP